MSDVNKYLDAEALVSPLKNEVIKPLSLSERLSAITPDTQKLMSGFKKVDTLIKGFRKANTYLIAGLEKSGKSSICMSIANNLLQQGKKILYINTELPRDEFTYRMVSQWKDIAYAECEGNEEYKEEWVLHFSNCLYMDLEDFTDTGAVVSQDLMIKKMELYITDGIDAIFIDNLTTFKDQPTNNRSGWEELAKCMSRVINFTKQNNVTTFLVLHTKNSGVYTDTPEGIRHILETDTPEAIFQESVTVVKRPNISDIYGGGGILSQLSGTMLIWRPFQKYMKSRYQRLAMLILESFRHSQSGQQIDMEFDGSKYKFVEAPEDDIDL